MKIHQSLSERRNVLARMTLGLVNKPTALTTDERTRLSAIRGEMDALESDLRADAERRHAAAFRSYLRAGLGPRMDAIPELTSEERRILTERRDMGTGGQAAGPGATAGFFVPAEFSERVNSAAKFYGPMLDLATIQDTVSGAPRAYPEDNDTSVSGEQVDENSSVTIGTDISNLNGVVLKSFKYSSKLIKVSIELVQDAGFDLEAYLADRFAIRIARALHPKLTTGAGTTEPVGIVTAAAVGATASGYSSNDGSAAGPNTIGTDDLVALEASVDPAYRRGAVFMLHPNTLAALRKVKDKNGRPVFPDLHGGGQNRILNYPVALNPDMDQLQTNAGSPPVTRKTVAFGNVSKYVVRRVPMMVLRLEETYVEEAAIAYLAFQRYDANLIDGGGGAVKLLTNVY